MGEDWLPGHCSQYLSVLVVSRASWISCLGGQGHERIINPMVSIDGYSEQFWHRLDNHCRWHHKDTGHWNYCKYNQSTLCYESYFNICSDSTTKCDWCE